MGIITIKDDTKLNFTHPYKESCPYIDYGDIRIRTKIIRDTSTLVSLL